MRREDIIRAWRDDDVLAALTDSERAELPDHPSGNVELIELEAAVGGGDSTHYIFSWGCACPGVTTPTCVCTPFTGGCACPSPPDPSCVINTCAGEWDTAINCQPSDGV